MRKSAPVLAALATLLLAATGFLSPQALGAQGAGTGVVLGFVRDSLGRAISGAAVSVEDRQASTNSLGAFELASVPTGVHPLYVRHIGYVSQTRTVTLFEGDTLRAQLTLARLVTLDTVAVEASGSGIAEFEERRTTGPGYYITRADLQRERRVTDVLGRVPGLRIQGRRGESYAASSRQTTSCLTHVFMDGVPVYTGPRDSPFNLNTLNINDVEGIEFYRSELTPAKYSRMGSACGVLVIWTRR